MAVAAPARASGAAVPATTTAEQAAVDGPRQQRVTVLGTLVLVVADAVVLGTLVAIYFALKTGAPSWPPRGVRLGIYLPTVVTVTAAMSAFSVQWAIWALRRNDQRNAVIGIIMTVVFALAIVNAEWYMLQRAGFGPSKHAYGTLYYTLFGFHMVHVVAAIVALVVVGVRAVAGHFSSDNLDGARAAAVLWHYANVVWLTVLITVYFLSKHRGR
jgi:heme/copper-type cytochrome/quinol oxidase subunit 3